MVSTDLAGIGESVPGLEEIRLTLDVRPNPLRDGGTISFVFPEATEGGISIYTVTGRRVAELPIRLPGAGSGEVTWNGCDMDGHRMSPGLYFCRLKAARGTVTRKFMILR